jgi:phosphotriesterase-related protein
MSPFTRRALLRAAAAAATLPRQSRQADRTVAPQIQTVTGPVPARDLGIVLMHEHVLVDFVGAASVSRARYDREAAIAKAVPHLRRLGELGCRTLVECTPAYLGRDPELLARLARESGLHIVTNTGYYGAANDKFVPAHTAAETPDQLAARWIREARDGIENTGIKPGFMKIGVDSGPLSDIDAKLVTAAARTHRETGLPIASHTGDGVAALAQLDLLARETVPLSAFIWVHAQSEKDQAIHEQAARRGAWVEFDGVSETSVERHADLVMHMTRAGLLGRVLVSHDAGWYHVGEPDGGAYRPHDTIFTRLIPLLKGRGFPSQDVGRLLIENPRRALTR